MIHSPVLGRGCEENGVLIYLKHDITCLNLSWYSRLAIQLSIAAKKSGGSISNNDAFVGLSIFVGSYVIILRQCTVGRNSGP